MKPTHSSRRRAYAPKVSGPAEPGASLRVRARAWLWRKLVLIDQAVERRIMMWGDGR